MFTTHYCRRVGGHALFSINRVIRPNDTLFQLAGRVLPAPTKYTIELSPTQHVRRPRKIHEPFDDLNTRISSPTAGDRNKNINMHDDHVRLPHHRDGDVRAFRDANGVWISEKLQTT